jgi:hypothetical protein
VTILLGMLRQFNATPLAADKVSANAFIALPHLRANSAAVQQAWMLKC